MFASFVECLLTVIVGFVRGLTMSGVLPCKIAILMLVVVQVIVLLWAIVVRSSLSPATNIINIIMAILLTGASFATLFRYERAGSFAVSVAMILSFVGMGLTIIRLSLKKVFKLVIYPQRENIVQQIQAKNDAAAAAAELEMLETSIVTESSKNVVVAVPSTEVPLLLSAAASPTTRDARVLLFGGAGGGEQKQQQQQQQLTAGGDWSGLTARQRAFKLVRHFASDDPTLAILKTPAQREADARRRKEEQDAVFLARLKRQDPEFFSSLVAEHAAAAGQQGGSSDGVEERETATAIERDKKERARQIIESEAARMIEDDVATFAASPSSSRPALLTSPRTGLTFSANFDSDFDDDDDDDQIQGEDASETKNKHFSGSAAVFGTGKKLQNNKNSNNKTNLPTTSAKFSGKFLGLSRSGIPVFSKFDSDFDNDDEELDGTNQPQKKRKNNNEENSNKIQNNNNNDHNNNADDKASNNSSDKNDDHEQLQREIEAILNGEGIEQKKRTDNEKEEVKDVVVQHALDDQGSAEVTSMRNPFLHSDRQRDTVTFADL